MELKTLKDIYQYLMNGYKYELRDVEIKQGKIQKRLKDEELGNELNQKIKNKLQFEDLFVELKLGPTYNRTITPWIQIFSPENRKGTKGRYIGISFNADEQKVSSWIGFGRSGKKQAQIILEAKEYIRKYKILEENLENGYEYNLNFNQAIIITKSVIIKDIIDSEFLEDLNYLVDLYKRYESQFESATFKQIKDKNKDNSTKTLATKEDIQKINQMMLQITQEFGELVKVIQKLNLQ